jgi:hypothetical protein
MSMANLQFIAIRCLRKSIERAEDSALSLKILTWKFQPSAPNPDAKCCGSHRMS